MTDSEAVALMQAVLDTPDDGALRLVYADWLEEHGGPAECDQAAFIRLQCARESLPEGDLRTLPLERRERALLALYEGDWTAEVRPLVHYHAFRRGFVEEVGLPTRPFLRHAEAIFRTAPVLVLHLWDHEEGARALGDCPFLRQLRHLDLSGTTLDDLDAVPIVSSPHLAGLVGLNLCNCEVGPATISALAHNPHLSGLRKLYLAGNLLADAGARALARSPYLGALQDLHVAFNAFTGQGQAVLRQRFGAAVSF